MRKYLDILQNVVDNGVNKDDRTGIGGCYEIYGIFYFE